MKLTNTFLNQTIINAKCCLAEKADKYSRALSHGKNDKCLLKEIMLLERYIKILECYKTSTNTTSPEPLPPPPAVCINPSAQAQIQSFTNIVVSGITVNWTRGNGMFVIVVARKIISGIDPTNNNPLPPPTFTGLIDPVPGQIYNPSSVFGLGDATGTNNYVIYVGTGTSVTMTTPGETLGCYTFTVYEYNNNTPLYGCYLTPGSSDTGCTGLP